MKHLFLFFVLLSAFSLSEIAIAPSDEKILYVGRFDRQKKEGPRCSWPASRVTIHFKGPSLDATLSTTSEDHWQVIVDGKPTQVIPLTVRATRYSIASNLSDEEHTVDLIKRTESHVGTSQILGFFIPDSASLLQATPSARRIEIIGDSITCGYGNEAASKEENFTPKTENASLTYGFIASRALKADYISIAWSGKKLWPDNSILDYYSKTLSTDSENTWKFKEQIPDVVLINLGTNEFRKQNPEEAGWVQAYKDFILRIRQNYPDCHIYCATGSMMSNWPEDRKPRETILRYVTRVVNELKSAGDTKIHFIDFGVQKPENGMGADWHPSIKTQIEMGKQLQEQLVKDLGWSPASTN